MTKITPMSKITLEIPVGTLELLHALAKHKNKTPEECAAMLLNIAVLMEADRTGVLQEHGRMRAEETASGSGQDTEEEGQPLPEEHRNHGSEVPGPEPARNRREDQ